jgi:hypothetical protein
VASRTAGFDDISFDAFTGDVVPQRLRADALYVRISGSAEQESSLAANAELRETASGPAGQGCGRVEESRLGRAVGL